MQRTRLFLVSLSHFCVDSYSSLVPPLLPLLKTQLGLTLAQTGFLGTIVSICNISQPLMGMWADRMKKRYLVTGGLLMCAIFAPLLGIVSDYWLLVITLIFVGIGVAAFHPQVFSLAGELSEPRRSFGLAWFIFGGTIAIGLTPIWVPLFAEEIGLSLLPLVSIPGLFCVLLLQKFVPLNNTHISTSSNQSNWQSLKKHTFPLSIITTVVVLRTITGLGFGTFITLLCEERGLDLVSGGIALGIYNTGGVIGALIAGYLAEHIETKKLVYLSLFLATPFLYWFVDTESSTLGYIFLTIGGGLLISSNSILVALAQKLAPENSALASSLPLGFSWGLASLSLPIIGRLADLYGVTTTLSYLSLLPLLTGVLALILPTNPEKG